MTYQPIILPGDTVNEVIDRNFRVIAANANIAVTDEQVKTAVDAIRNNVLKEVK